MLQLLTDQQIRDTIDKPGSVHTYSTRTGKFIIMQASGQDQTVLLPLSKFVKKKRKETGLTQQALASKAGVGLRFVRELERDKPSLQMDKVNQVLMLFGYELGPVPLNRKN